MSKPDTKDDLELHPWLKGFDKKHGNEKIDILKERVKALDNLVGTSSVLILCQMFFIAAIFIGLFAGSVFNLSSDAGSTLISFVKSNIKK